VSAAEIPGRLGQACEALETVPLLAAGAGSAGVSAPVLSALSRLIEGTLPLDDWVAMVRARQPELARDGGRVRGWLIRLRDRLRRLLSRPAVRRT
jgi:glycerol-3-phosphate dehydrogenase (NAD(P)+)